MRFSRVRELYKSFRDFQEKEFSDPLKAAAHAAEFWKPISKWSFDITKNTIVVISIAVAANKTGIYWLYIPVLYLTLVQIAEVTSQFDEVLYSWLFLTPREHRIAKCISYVLFAALYLFVYHALTSVIAAIK